MNDSQLLEAVQSIMINHVFRAVWSTCSGHEQIAIAKYAIEDISLELPWVTQDNLTSSSLEFSAVIEQIGYLAKKKDEILFGDSNKQIVSESIDGISQSYATNTNSKAQRYSLRALAFIERIKSAKLGHSLRVYRG